MLAQFSHDHGVADVARVNLAAASKGTMEIQLRCS
jgi:hypothetical protein